MHKRLEVAFSMTAEAHSAAFERFANAFLIDDYPELEPLGGKRDKGMDARIVYSETGVPYLIVQSTVSPAGSARVKVWNTVGKFEGKQFPQLFLYCTPAKIGLLLDGTKAELRKKHGIVLEVYDGAWFS